MRNRPGSNGARLSPLPLAGGAGGGQAVYTTVAPRRRPHPNPSRKREGLSRSPLRRIITLANSFAGPLLFWGSYAIAGLKPAIALTLLLTVAHVGWRLWRGRRVEPLFLALSALAIATGIIDLIATTPFAIRYEAVATNLVFAALFAWGAVSDPPLMQRFAEAARGAPFAGGDAGRTRFFRAFAGLWAAYATTRALVALATGLWLPLAQALAVRAIFGTMSMAAMIALSLSARRLFMALRARGWFDDQRVSHTTMTQSP